MSNTFRVVVNKSKKRKKLINKKEAERVMQYIVDEPIEGFNIYKALQDSKDAGKFEGKTEMAINLLKKNIPDDIISECSGISPEELNKLKDQITK